MSWPVLATAVVVNGTSYLFDAGEGVTADRAWLRLNVDVRIVAIQRRRRDSIHELETEADNTGCGQARRAAWRGLTQSNIRSPVAASSQTMAPKM